LAKIIFRNYQETLDYFFHSRPHGTIKLGLERIKRLLHLIGNPQTSFDSLQIAGTNGKGSVTRFLSTIFTESGFKTGANYSPHLVRFNERITCNNEMISDEDIVNIANEIYEAVDSMDKISEEMKPSFFECATAMAFKYFQKNDCEIATVEVGLGGRLDATSALNPDVTAITSINFDHMKTLGDTIEKIAFEKAGIIKSNTPMICGTDMTDAVRVIEMVAREKKAPLYQFLEDYHYIAVKNELNANEFHFQSKKLNMNNLKLRMNGTHQMKNASTAIMAYLVYCEVKGLEYSTDVIRRSLEKAYWPGRFEKISDDPIIIVDGAHNGEGIDALIENWQIYFSAQKPILLTGMLSGKDYHQICKVLSDISDSVIITEPNSPRETDTSLIVQEYSKHKEKQAVAYLPDHKEACLKALEQAQRKKIPILITGSLYVIGYLKEIMSTLS